VTQPTPPATHTPAQTPHSALFAALHQGSGHAYFWQAAGKISTWFEAGEPVPPPSSNDVYFSVNLAARAGGEHSRGKVAILGCIYAEFDAKDFTGGKPATLAHVEALSPAPSALVDSGGGYHCYWLLTEPWLLSSDAERERARRLQARWVKHMGGDKAASDIGRVLRVPGSLNCKPEYGTPRPVVLLDLRNDRRYDVADLEALLPAPEPVPAPVVRAVVRQEPATGPRTGRASASDVIATFNRDHAVESLLASYGATRSHEGWACNCGVAHTHATQLGVTSGGLAVFYSARCRWAPARTDRNGRPIADAFDLFTMVEHTGDKTAALRAINPIAGASAALRLREAERKREARRDDAAETLQAVRDRAAEDGELLADATASRVLHALLATAGLKVWCRPSVAALAERVERSERTVQRALASLEGRYIATEEHERDGQRWRGSEPSRPKATALRTFLRTPLLSVGTRQSATIGVTREKAPCHPIIVQERVSAGQGATTLAGEPAAWEAWEWTDAPHGAHELLDPAPLDRLGGLALVAPAEPAAPGSLRAWLLACRDAPVPPLAGAEGGGSPAPGAVAPGAAPAELAAPALDLAAPLTAADNRAWFRICRDAPLPELAPAPLADDPPLDLVVLAPAPPFTDDAPAGPGAAFSPNAPACTPSALDNWALLCEHWRTHVDASDAPRSPRAVPEALPFTAADVGTDLAAELAAAEQAARSLKRDAVLGRGTWWQYHAAARAVKELSARMGRQRDAGLAMMLALSPVPPLDLVPATFHQDALFRQVVNCAD